MTSGNPDQNRIDLDKLDQLRKSYELPHHWQLRKEFLQVHADKFDADRLICLSNVFVNINCMGLTYPNELMELIKELGIQVKGLEYYRYQLEQEDEPQAPRREHQNHYQHRHHQHHQQHQQQQQPQRQQWRRQQQHF